MSRVGVVLVVDDDPDILEIVTLLLDVNGYGVATDTDARRALQRVQDGLRPALMLVDLRMPGFDGAELIRSIRGDPALSDIPIVILSGEIHGLQESALLGIEGYLSKPVELDDLLSTVSRYVALPGETTDDRGLGGRGPPGGADAEPRWR
jgi:CheY-like chemotaxis protein